MNQLFEAEFRELSPAVASALRAEVERVVRLAAAQYKAWQVDPSREKLTNEDFLAIIGATFDLASRLRRPGG